MKKRELELHEQALVLSSITFYDKPLSYQSFMELVVFNILQKTSLDCS